MNNNYVVYHLHSDLSNGVTNIDSITKYNQYIDKQKNAKKGNVVISNSNSKKPSAVRLPSAKGGRK